MIFLVSMYVGNVGFCFVFILYRGILVPLKMIWLLNQSAVFDLGEKFMVLRVNTLNSGYYKEQGCISGHKPEGKNCNQEKVYHCTAAKSQNYWEGRSCSILLDQNQRKAIYLILWWNCFVHQIVMSSPAF